MRALPLLACLVLVGCGSPETAFDQERWLQADLATRERAHMVTSLLEGHPLKGVGRTEIIQLLGPPTPTDKWGGTEMIYVLGPDAGVGIDHEWLLIELDQQGRVQEYRVAAD